MPTAEVLQPEAGDDRNKEAEIEKLYDMVYGQEMPDGILYETDIPGVAPGETVSVEHRIPPQRLELRRSTRYLGRASVGYVISRPYPIQYPYAGQKAHIRRFRPFN